MSLAYYGAKKQVVAEPPAIIPIPKGKSLNFETYVFGSEVSVDKPEQLHKQSCAYIYIGVAYDGLPLLLHVSRAHSIKSEVLNSLGVATEQQLHSSISKPLEILEKAIKERSCLTGIEQTTALGNKAKSYYKTYKGMGSLLVRTSFSQLTGDNSVSALNERGEDYAWHVEYKRTSMHMGLGLGGTLKSDEPLAVKIDEKTKKVSLEPLFIETLTTVFPSLEFRCETQNSSYRKRLQYAGSVLNREDYFNALNDSKSVKFVISRSELANVILLVAREVHKTMHAKGRVHGDIKPPNILFMQEGVKLIDSRGCKSGSICATYTPNWAAPEQILGKPVTFAADTYALGMLALFLVSGEIYGEIRNFKMPGAKSTIQVLDTEGVWIDSSTNHSDEARTAWREALAKWLSFDSKKRPQTGEEFADQLEKLLKAHPLDGLPGIEMDGTIGAASLGKVSKDSISKFWPGYKDVKNLKQLKSVPCWILRDSYPKLS